MPHVRLCLLLCLAACSGSSSKDTDDASTGGDASTGAAGSETGEPTSTGMPTGTATPTEPTGDCGNSIVEPGEACDDGNFSDNDECTTTCTVPACDDGRKDGEESDVDCGGGCSACADEATCHESADCVSGLCASKCVSVRADCLELHLYYPSLPDGDYDIDPDGDGTPTKFHCDMVNGGWTEIAHDDFDMPSGWSAGTPGACGTLSDHLLGGAGQFGAGATAEKTFPLLGVMHTEVRVVSQVIIIDSWETESMTVEIDGQSVASAICSQGIKGSCGIADSQCGGAGGEGDLRLVGARELAGDSATLRFSSSLDQDANDEAWGLDSVSLQVR